MSTEDLLKPRYKVIADWPEMRERFIGNPIIIMDKQDEEGWYTTNGHYQQSFFEQYPHLFKSLSWWEERKPEDMPQYLRTDGKVYKVKEYEELNSDSAAAWFEGTNYGACLRANVHPATEQEYLQSKTT